MLLTDLEGMNVLVSPTSAEQVEAKWRTIYRAYKSAKDRGTGTSATKFVFMEEMDKIFHDNPLVSSPNSVTVGLENRPTPAPMIADPVKEINIDKNTEKSTRKSKPHREKETLLDIKKTYYEEKIKEKKKKRELLESYLEKKEKAREQRHKELMMLLNKNRQD